MKPPLAPALAFVLTCSPVAARADYRQSYLDAQRAERAGRLVEAAAALEAAIAERPQEQARARLVGAIPEPYLPFHRLGVVRYELHDCPQALAAFERSAAQGVAVGLPDAVAEATARQRDCGDLRDAAGTLAAARAAAAGAPAGGETAAAVAALLDESSRDLATARASWDFAAARRALASAVASRRIVEESAEPSPTAPPATVPDPASPPVGAPSQPPSAPDELPATRAPAQASVAEPSATATPPSLPASVRAAVEAYFAGSYSAAVELLDVQLRKSLADDATRFLAHLMRGASRYALYLLGGESETTLRDRAAEDLRAAQRLRPAFRPGEREFSPRLVEFYEGLVANSR